MDNTEKMLETNGPILRDITSRESNLCQALLDKVFIGRRGKIVSPVYFKIIIGAGLFKTCKSGSDYARELFKLFSLQ